MAGYRICTQQNKVCAGGAFSSSGGFSTLRTSTDLVGIGTSTPSEKLSINGGVFLDSDIIRYGSSSAPTLNFRYFVSSTSTIPNLTSAFTYATSTTNTPLLTLSTKSSRYGRIGIGTSSPSALFAINALNASNQADNLFYVGSSTINAFVVDNHGNVGIGTTNADRKLTIQRSSAVANTEISLFGQGGTMSATIGADGASTDDLLIATVSGIRFFSGSTIGSSGIPSNERMRIVSAGNVGIGTTLPGSRLEVENTAVADDVLLLEDSSGLCEAQPATTGLTWSCSSDIRLKTNIRNASPVLSYIAGIPLRDYTVIKTNEEAMGPIAQELQETYPELVREGDDGYLQASTLSSWQVVKAIQELNEKVSQLSPSISSGQINEGWSIDQQTGRVTAAFTGGLDLGGNSIQNVSAILSASGSWRIDESGLLVVEEVRAKKVSTKEIELEDSSTTESYCVKILSGTLSSVPGKCGSVYETASLTEPTTTTTKAQ